MKIQGYELIDDSFRVDSTDGSKGTGYKPRDWDQYPLASLKCSRRMSKPLIPRSEWKERIEEKTRKKTWVKDLCDRKGSRVKDQSSSSYCWIHAPVRGIECRRVLQGDRPLTLSAFYAGSDIKDGRNEGGSGITGVEWLAEHGTPVESMWEPMKFRGERTDAMVRNSAKHKILTYEDLQPRVEDEYVTAILNDDPVTVGIPAWGHEVLITFLVWDDGEVLPGIDNSWGDTWGTNGRGVLKGRMKIFDEAGVIASVMPSVE